MEKQEFKGDFTGFQFGDFHSSDFGLVRVSGGDKYSENLQPEINDITAEVPGMNGQYFFGSTYGTRTFDIEFAFDALTESEFRKLRTKLGTKKIQKLIFDERPYKHYMAKIESPIELSFVCFDGKTYTDDGSRGTGIKDRELRTLSDTTSRIYKGEGQVTFICYYPFAKSNFKVLPEAGNEYYEGSDSWAVSSGILSAEVREANEIDIYSAGAIKIYNPGDVETGFRLYIPAAALSNQITLQYEDAQLVIDPIELKEYAENAYDAGVIVDTNTGLITGVIPSTITVTKIIEVEGEPVKTEVTEVNEAIHIDYNGNVFYTTSGNIYNQFINSGYFFKFEPTDFISYDDLPVLQITGTSEGVQIFYDYLYF